jgi:peptide/nickel transport system permease protein
MTAAASMRPWRSSTGLAGLLILAVLAAIAGLALLGLWSPKTGAGQWAAASTEHWFGTNRLGEDILERALRGTVTAFAVGTGVTLGAMTLGALLGASAGWRNGGWLDQLISWLMGVLDSIPIYLFAAALAFAMGGQELAMYLAMILLFWTSTARLIRAEVMRLKNRDFVAAARIIGLPAPLIVLRHVLPNTAHLLLVQTVLTFVAAIKTEVILSFLGIGIDDGVSWGLMLAEATQDVLAGHLGNFLAASLLLFLMLLGLNLLADDLQDAVDVRELRP